MLEEKGNAEMGCRYTKGHACSVAMNQLVLGGGRGGRERGGEGREVGGCVSFILTSLCLPNVEICFLQQNTWLH